MMTKILNCKVCAEPVEVPERQKSIICAPCAEKQLAEKEMEEEFRENPPPEKYRALVKEWLAHPDFRRAYLHRRAAEKSGRE